MFMRKIEESCVLVQGMAERLGTGTFNAIHTDPEFEAAAYRSAILRCAACSEHKACKQLQAENSSLNKAPAYCRNW